MRWSLLVSLLLGCDGLNLSIDASEWDATQPNGSDGTTSQNEPVMVEECFDGVDNNDDALVDCDDPECWSSCDADGDGHRPFELGGEDCDDEEATAFPGAPELCDDGIDNDCDGNDILTPFASATMVDAAASKLTVSGSGGDLAGWSVSVAGDLNSDGWLDLAVGAPDAVVDAPNEGAAFIFYGPVEGELSLTVADITLYGEDDEGGFGVAGPGDVNGDGFDDLVVTDPKSNAGGNNSGAVYLFLGPLADTAAWSKVSDSLTTADVTVIGSAGDEIGSSVAGAGDINGDGFDDLVLGAPEFRDGDGAGFVLLGRPELDQMDELDVNWASARLLGSNGEAAGASVAGVGDVDGDGFDDVMIGAPGAVGNAGRAYLFRGPLEGTYDLGAAWAILEGEGSGDEAGSSFAAAGDVDGDGFADVMIGAPGYDDRAWSRTDVGAAYLVRGPFQGTSELVTASLMVVGERDGDRAGTALTAGDLNGDGQVDLVIGAPNAESGGGAYILAGVTTGTVTLDDSVMRVVSATLGDALGSALAIADLDSDGYEDLLIGSPGVALDAGAAYALAGCAY